MREVRVSLYIVDYTADIYIRLNVDPRVYITIGAVGVTSQFTVLSL